MPRPMVPIAVPSFGATRYSQLASRRLPAPSMFFGTNVGLPGMSLPMWREMIRAYRS